jgi:hypothetical protein
VAHVGGVSGREHKWLAKCSCGWKWKADDESSAWIVLYRHYSRQPPESWGLGWPFERLYPEGVRMDLIVLLLILFFIFGGLGGGYYGYHTYGAFGGGGILGLVLIICLVVWLVRGNRI